MVSLIVDLLILAIVVVVGFLITRRVVMLWTGADKEDATRMIWTFMRQTEVYHLSNDTMLVEDMWSVVRDIIGEGRYADLEKLSHTAQLFGCGYASGLPYLAFTVSYENDNEKCMIQNLLQKKMEEHLSIHGYERAILVDWKQNRKLKLPCVMLRYAETMEQTKILNAVLTRESEKVLQKYQPLIDEDVDSELSDSVGI